jgi:hypothetical protein
MHHGGVTQKSDLLYKIDHEDDESSTQITLLGLTAS